MPIRVNGKEIWLPGEREAAPPAPELPIIIAAGPKTAPKKDKK
jgi:hypothetical protein